MGQVSMPPVLAALASSARPAKKEPTETFRWIRGLHDSILEYQFGIAKWIMASLLLINGGGLIALRDVAEKNPQAAWGGGWFLVGIVASVLVGTFAWFNCNCVTVAADYRTNWTEVDYQESTKADRWDKWGMAFAWASVAAAMISLVAFTGGAIRAEEGLASAIAAPSAHEQPANPRPSSQERAH